MGETQAQRYREALATIPQWITPATAGERQIFLLPCGRRKKNVPTAACEMYISIRFQSARKLAERISGEYYIASAKHGLLHPKKIIDPYDLDLFSMSEDNRRRWVEDVFSKIPLLSEISSLVILGGDDYSKLLIDEAERRNLKVYAPQLGLNSVYAKAIVSNALKMAVRRDDLLTVYGAIQERVASGDAFLLKNLREQKLPVRGVYVFLDLAEPTPFGHARVVRIGTHGVSEGSKATLRGRLRNHFGQLSGTGNHRGSVFRLHVGRAMIAAGLATTAAFPSWGAGQQATPDIVSSEIELEKLVSDYLGRLLVVIIEADDRPSKRSLRAVIESNLIALFTEEDLYLDPGTNDWLGRNSPTPSISRSGLWNIRDVGRRYDRKALQVILDQLAWRLS